MITPITSPPEGADDAGALPEELLLSELPEEVFPEEMLPEELLPEEPDCDCVPETGDRANPVPSPEGEMPACSVRAVSGDAAWVVSAAAWVVSGVCDVSGACDVSAVCIVSAVVWLPLLPGAIPTVPPAGVCPALPDV